MRGKSILEVLTVYAGTRVLFTLLITSNPIIKWELKNLGWSYIGGVTAVLIPIIIILIYQRSPGSYGLSFSDWKTGLEMGMTCYLILMIPYVVMLALLLYGGLNTYQPYGSLIVSSAKIAAVILMLRVKTSENPKPKLNLLLLTLLLLFPVLLGAWVRRLSVIVVSTVVWQFLVSGFGEEVVYRGYYQSTINIEYGRPWTIMGVEFGPGLVLSSLLFALSHALNPFRPMEGIYTIDWWWGFSTLFSGLFYGLLRERTGGILASGIAHGLPDAVGEAANIILDLGFVTKG